MSQKFCIPDFCLWWTSATNYHYFSTIKNCWMLLSRMVERSNMWPIIIFILGYWIQAIQTIVCSSQYNVCIWYWYRCVPINACIQVLCEPGPPENGTILPERCHDSVNSISRTLTIATYRTRKTFYWWPFVDMFVQRQYLTSKS